MLIIEQTISASNYIAHVIRAFGSYRPICIPAAAVDDGVFCGNERDNRRFERSIYEEVLYLAQHKR